MVAWRIAKTMRTGNIQTRPTLCFVIPARDNIILGCGRITVQHMAEKPHYTGSYYNPLTRKYTILADASASFYSKFQNSA
jgi:hypothetical protein